MILALIYGFWVLVIFVFLGWEGAYGVILSVLCWFGTLVAFGWVIEHLCPQLDSSFSVQPGKATNSTAKESSWATVPRHEEREKRGKRSFQRTVPSEDSRCKRWTQAFGQCERTAVNRGFCYEHRADNRKAARPRKPSAHPGNSSSRSRNQAKDTRCTRLLIPHGRCERTAVKRERCDEHQDRFKRDHVTPKVSGEPKSVANRQWSGAISKRKAKRLLIDRFGPACWGCGIAPTGADGRVDEGLLEVDHLRAKKPIQGMPGGDDLFNLGILDRKCNKLKSNRMTIEELRKYNSKNRRVNTAGLVDLYEALDYAVEVLRFGAIYR